MSSFVGMGGSCVHVGVLVKRNVVLSMIRHGSCMDLH